MAEGWVYITSQVPTCGLSKRMWTVRLWMIMGVATGRIKEYRNN